MTYRHKTWIERVAHHLYDTPLLGVKNVQPWSDFYKTGRAVVKNLGTYAVIGALVGATQGFGLVGAVTGGAGRFMLGLLNTVPRVREDEVGESAWEKTVCTVQSTLEDELSQESYPEQFLSWIKEEYDAGF